MWLVCFTGRQDKIYWWDKFRLTDKNFRHVYLVQFQPDAGQWVLVDWKTGMCDVVIFHPDEMKYIFGQLENNQGTAILVKQRELKKEIHYRIPLIYCVQAVMQVIGMPTKWTYTPKQLYKRLIREGCEEILNHRSIEDGRFKRCTRSRSKCNEAQPADAETSAT